MADLLWIEWLHLKKQYESLPNDRDIRGRKMCSKGLFGFSASLRQGITVVIGQPGAGKSTLLQLTATKVVPDDGRITYYDENQVGYVWSKGTANRLPLAGFQKVRNSISYIPQVMHFQYHMTVEEDLLQLVQIHRISNPRRKIAALLTKWGLSAYRKTQINELSIGVLKRYMLAQSLLNNPKVWILDEPTDGLDDLGKNLLYTELIRDSAKGRITLIATRDMQLAECADDLLLLDWGVCRRLGRKKFLTASVPEGTVAAWYKAMQAFSERSPHSGSEKNIP